MDDDYRDVHRAADAAAPAMARAVVTAFRAIAGNVDPAHLTSALITDGADGAIGVVVVATESEVATRAAVEGPIRDAFADSGRRSVENLVGELRANALGDLEPFAEDPFDLEFEETRPRAASIADELAAVLVVQIDEQMRAAIRHQVELAFLHGVPPRELARRILDEGLGLTARQAGAVDAFRRRLEVAGVDAADVDRRTARYHEAHLRRRATTIARTETLNAANQGQLEAWRQATDAGLISADARREWVATFDDRLDVELCEPMDGVRIPLDQPWVLPNGARVMVPSFSHPNCRCTASLIPA